LPPGGSGRATRLAYLRLLFRAGFLADHRRSDDEDIATAERWGHLLLADSVPGVLRNVAAYEVFYGVCAAWRGWLRDPEQMINLLNRELRTMNVDPTDFPSIVGRWPPPETRMLGAMVQRVVGPRANLDESSD
jgi:hypothetical protein